MGDTLILLYFCQQLTSDDLEVIQQGSQTILSHVLRKKRKIDYDDSHDDCLFPDIPEDDDATMDAFI